MSTTETASGVAPAPGADLVSSGPPSAVAGQPRSFLDRFDYVWGKARPWLTALWIARVSVASVVLGCLLFTVPDAVHDILRALAQDLSWEGRAVGLHWHRLIAFFLGSFFWAVSIHYAARVLLWFDLGMLPDEPTERNLPRRSSESPGSSEPWPLPSCC